jgi:hypothetical protein
MSPGLASHTVSGPSVVDVMLSIGEVDQLAELNRIVTLKELGFTLQQVG